MLDDQLQRLELLLCEVVLPSRHICLAHLAWYLRRGQPHHRERSIRPVVDEFGCRLSTDGKEELIPHLLIEGLCRLTPRVVVDTRSIDILDLLVEDPLGEPYLTDTIKELLEVVVRRARLQTLIVQSKALDKVLPQALCRPLTKPRALLRLHPIADGDNDIKIVEVRGLSRKIGNLDFSLRLLLLKLPLLIDMEDISLTVVRDFPKRVAIWSSESHTVKREPYGLVVHTDIKPDRPILGLAEKERFGRGG